MTNTTTTGIWVQVEQPYLDLFLADGDYWTRSEEGDVYVYADGSEDDPLAEVAKQYFVSVSEATEKGLEQIETTASDSEVSPTS